MLGGNKICFAMRMRYGKSAMLCIIREIFPFLELWAVAFWPLLFLIKKKKTRTTIRCECQEGRFIFVEKILHMAKSMNDVYISTSSTMSTTTPSHMDVHRSPLDGCRMRVSPSYISSLLAQRSQERLFWLMRTIKIVQVWLVLL